MNSNSNYRLFCLMMLIIWVCIGVTCIVTGGFPFITSICLWVLVLVDYIEDIIKGNNHDNY